MRDSVRLLLDKQIKYPGIIYLMGLAIVLVYAFTTNYIEVGDTAREYYIYSFLAQGGDWQTLFGKAQGIYSLQRVCLSTTAIPAYLQRLFGFDMLLFFKLYTCFFISFLPVAVYFIAKKFIRNTYAFLVAVFFMGQVCFIHAPSMARSNVALLFFALALLVILKLDISKRVRYSVIFVLAGGMVISHYSTTYISLFLFLATGIVILLWQLFRRTQLPSKNSILAVCLSLVIGITVWYGFITHTPWVEAVRFVKQITLTTFSPLSSTGGSPEKNYEITKVESRDKITQVAFGVKNPDGDATFTFNWATFVFNWLVVVIMSYGLLITLVKWRKDKAVPLGYLILSMIGYATIIGVVILPWVSRAYGIERTYYQMLVFLGIYFIFGCSDIAKRLRLKPIMIILPVLLPYLYFTYTTGIIYSITGWGQ